MSYLSNIICYGYVKNLWISIITTCINTLETCVDLLFQLPIYWSSRLRITLTPFQHISYNTFYIYHLIALYTFHGILPIHYFSFFLVFAWYWFCATWKTIHNKRGCNVGSTYCWFSHTFYISVIKKVLFHLPHIQILGTHPCGNIRREAFKHRRAFKYVLCCCDYAKSVASSFTQQTQSKYYGCNRYLSIEGIELVNFSAT